jgi:uncharacterized protein (DUF433 family)
MIAVSVPLRVDPDGTIRVGDSRVLLEIVIGEFERGASPEAIVHGYDTLNLADVYAVIAYYLSHREEVAAYLLRREKEAAALRQKVEKAGMSDPNFWQELVARRFADAWCVDVEGIGDHWSGH